MTAVLPDGINAVLDQITADEPCDNPTVEGVEHVAVRRVGFHIEETHPAYQRPTARYDSVDVWNKVAQLAAAGAALAAAHAADVPEMRATIARLTAENRFLTSRLAMYEPQAVAEVVS